MNNQKLKIVFILLVVICFSYFLGYRAAFAINPPISNAGPDKTIKQGESIILQGFGYDSQGLNITYNWVCNGGYLSDSNSAQPIFYSYSTGNYICTLTVTNSASHSASDSVSISVQTNTGFLTINKTARNLSSGNLVWASSINASPADVLSFMITIQNNTGQTVNNVIIRDILPTNLIYRGSLVIDNISDSGSIISGINIGSLVSGRSKTITYQAQVASAQNFNFGNTTLNNSVVATSNETTISSSAYASVVIIKSGVLGATSVSTGLTNNLFLDSFFLPILLAGLGVWIWKTRIVGIHEWIDNRRIKHKSYLANKQIGKIIEKIKQKERA